MLDHRLVGRHGMIAGVDFVDTDEVKFSNFNSKGGAIIDTNNKRQGAMTSQPL